MELNVLFILFGFFVNAKKLDPNPINLENIFLLLNEVLVHLQLMFLFFLSGKSQCY